MEVEVDFWENQRYKPLQGGWTRPFTGGVYPFSDISCSNKLEINVNPNQTTFFMPPGWEWSSELWKVDKRNIFGEVDADGWSYAISFEALFDQSLRRALRKERNSRSLVRRRRWVRTRYCKSSKMIEKFAARVDWVTILREKIDAIAKKNHENFFLLSEYHVVKCKTIEKMILSIDAKLDKINESLGALRNKLLLMNTFLEERGEIEQCYAEKLEKLSLKWRDAGDETEVSSYRSKYFSSGNKGSRKDSIDEKVVDEKGKRKGFFEVVSRANDEISRRLHEFSVLLTQGLPADVLGIIREIEDALTECHSEGTQYRTSLYACLKQMEESFEDYKICQDGSHLELQAESEILFSSIYNIGASLSESSSISNSMVASTTFSHLHSEKFIDGSTVNDVWSAVKRYHWNLIGADSALLLYNALRKQQQKRVERVSASVSALLRATVKAFAHEQFRVWEDAADMLEAVGTNATLINSTTLSNSGAIDSAYEIIENYTELGGPSEKATSDWQNYSEVEQHDATAQQTKTAYESSPSGNFDVPRTISQSSCDSEKQVDRNESIDESQKEDNFSSFQVPFALFDVLSYTVIHSSERIDFGNNPVGVPNVMNKELNSWERQGVMITYNRVMHIVEVTGTVEDPKFEPGSISLSISLRDVSVSPVFIPKDGFRDAFEVKFLKAKPSMSLRSSTDPIVSIIFVGRDSETVRHFMAVIANPFVQLDVDPPDFEEEIREEYVEKADERVVLL